MTTIYVLWIRQLIRFIRTRSRVIASLAQPVLFLVALGFGFGPVYAKAGGGDYIQFLAPGVIAMSILFTAVFTGIEIVWDKQIGFLKEVLVAPVSRFGIIFGRTLGGATVAFIQGIILFLITLLVGFRPTNLYMIPIALVFMSLVALLFAALGAAIAARMNDMQAFPLIINFLVMPLFFLSGSLFPIDGLPKALLWVTKINPLSYGIDGIRGALVGANHFSLWTDFSVMAIITVIIVFIGAYMFSKAEA